MVWAGGQQGHCGATPARGKATVERIATNAVMVECLVMQRADAVLERIIEQLLTTH